MDNETKKQLIEAGIDVNKGVLRLMGRTDKYLSLLKKFLQDDSFAKLKDAFAREDCTAAYNAAHALKGISANLSLELLNERVCLQMSILQSAYNEENPQQKYTKLKLAEKLIPRVETAYDAAVKAIRSL